MRAGQLTLVALVNGWRRPGLFTLPVMEDKLAEVLTLNLACSLHSLCAFHWLFSDMRYDVDRFCCSNMECVVF